MDYLWFFYGFFYGFYDFFMVFFRVQYVKNSGNYSYTCSEVLDDDDDYYYYYYPLFSLTFFLAVNSKIKYFSCSCTYSCYFYWVVSLGLVYFFSRLRRANSKW